MGLGISSEDFIGRWSLSFSDTDFVNGKPGPARLGLAIQLKFFAAHGFLVQDHAALPADGVLYLAEQLGLEADAVFGDVGGATINLRYRKLVAEATG